MSEKTHAEIVAEMKSERPGLQNTTLNANNRHYAELLEAAHKREVDALKQRINELSAEVAAKDEVIQRLNDALAEEQRRKMATAENSSAVGNAAKLREALEAVRDAHFVREENGEDCEGFDVEADDGTGRPLICVVEDALAAPVRNCDVGTAEEQAQRMADFCKRHYKKAVPGRHICSACKFHNKDAEWECYFSWAQLPYESEAAKCGQ